MESQKPGNSPKPGPEVVERQRVAKSERRRVFSWTVQNVIKGVRWCCKKDSRFCQSSRDKSLTVGCVRCSEDERAHGERDEGAQVPQ